MSKEEVGVCDNRGGAEIVNSLEPKSSIAVGYDPLFGSPEYDDLILLELDEKLLPDLLHQRVTLRGQPDEDAVLCTRSNTYALKFVATSNSAFLIPPSHSSPTPLPNGQPQLHPQQLFAPVIKFAPGTVELTHVAPRLDMLRSLLSESPCSAQEVMDSEDFEESAEIFNNRKLYTWDDLIESVQASDDELRAGLEALSALEIDGYWRIVDEKLMDNMLRMLLHNSVLNDWSLDTLNEDDVVDALASDGFSHKLALHCLRIFGGKVDGGEAICASWRLDERHVCIHFARETLRAGKMKIENFMQEWLRKVPDGMQANFDMLEGEVLTEKIGVETWVRAFSVSSLPITPPERFSVLFRERSKWEWKDLQPYIRDLSVPGLSSEGLLLKYTRRTQPTPDAEPVFSAR